MSYVGLNDQQSIIHLPSYTTRLRMSTLNSDMHEPDGAVDPVPNAIAEIRGQVVAAPVGIREYLDPRLQIITGGWGSSRHVEQGLN